MAKKSVESVSSTPIANKSDGTNRPPELMELFAKVNQALNDGEPKKALDLIARSKMGSQWITNAQGVCQLRMGNAKVAVEIFRGLVLGAGGIHLRTDVPTVFKTNYAAALLAAENMGGCQSVMAEVRDDHHPAVAKLKTTIQQWEKGLSLWERINLYMGGQPARPVQWDQPPGDLE